MTAQPTIYNYFSSPDYKHAPVRPLYGVRSDVVGPMRVTWHRLWDNTVLDTRHRVTASRERPHPDELTFLISHHPLCERLCEFGKVIDEAQHYETDIELAHLPKKERRRALRERNPDEGVWLVSEDARVWERIE